MVGWGGVLDSTCESSRDGKVFAIPFGGLLSKVLDCAIGLSGRFLPQTDLMDTSSKVVVF